MSKIILFLAALGVAVIAVYSLITIPKVATQMPVLTKAQDRVEYTASFAIFTNGIFRVFSAPMYHNRSKDVFIQADNPNIAHVKKAEITWNDFFKTLPIKLTKQCLTTGTKQTFCTNANDTLRFYLNGKRDQSALDKQIENGDKLLVSYGNKSEDLIEKQLQQVPNP